MAVDTSAVAKLDVEPGTLPETMAAWVIRQEREGEPTDAFQLEQIEVPEPGAFEVIVRVMAAGVNFNNVWAALGKPVSVFGYGDHPEFGHHIGGSDASGIVWKVGEGVTRWKPGDEVVVHCNQASYEDVEVHGLDPMAAPSQQIWGYETTWGSFAQFTKVQAQQLLLAYVERGILPANPFQTLDTEGVGQLVRMAVEKGRKTRPNIKLGICGEHGGDPASIHFFNDVGLDYVSCSPFRVPVARLAAAQAALENPAERDK